MKKTCILLLITVLCFLCDIKSQIVITNNDMPNYKDIYIIDIKNDISSSFDHTLTGEDYIWDISNISFDMQRNDTFIKLSATPLLYNAYFGNNLDLERKASIATPRNMSMPAPGITVKDVYFFYKEDSLRFSEVGFGATINDIPMPVKYNTLDVWYRFPITYPSTDTSFSSYSFNLTNYGYFGEKKRRINTVDGWGTLVTDKGAFPVVRIKSELFIEDTVYYDSYAQGFNFNRTETEYKWIGAQIGVPLLKITERLNAVSIEAFDSLYLNTASLNQYNDNNIDFSAYPNPAQDYIILNTYIKKKSDVTITFFNTLGEQLSVKHTKDLQGVYIDKIDLKSLNLTGGIYFLNIKTSYTTYTVTVVVR